MSLLISWYLYFFSTNDQHYYFEIQPTLLDHFDIIKSKDGNAFGWNMVDPKEYTIVDDNVYICTFRK